MIPNNDVAINVPTSPHSEKINATQTVEQHDLNDKTTLLNTNTQKSQDSWLRRRIVQPFITILKSGATAHGLSMSIACGVSAGLFPIPATTSVVVLILCYILKLNIAMCQLINLLVTPLNLASFIYFIECGNYLFGIVSKDTITLDRIQADPYTAVQTFGFALLRGVVAWIMMAPVITFAVYFAVKPVISTLLVSMSKTKVNV